VHVLVEVERGHHHDPHRVSDIRTCEPACHLQPVEHRHPDVDQDDVGPERQRPLHGGGAVGGLADHRHVGLGIQDDAIGAADVGLIVGHEEPDGEHGHRDHLLGR
jgi:hypothetical protein